MKLMRFLYCALLAIPVTGQAQVNFQSISLAEAQQQAAKENKLIFLDCQTKWCGACKAMAKNFFSTQEAGDFFNPNFVCVLMDMETPEAKEANKKLQVKAYPTFFILDSKGNIVHRIVGGRSADKFIPLVKQGMKTETSLSYLDSLYKQKQLKPSQDSLYITQLDDASRDKEVRVVSDEVFRSLPDSERAKKDKWYLFQRTELLFPTDYMFQWLIDHKSQFDANIGAEEVDQRISEVFQLILRNGKDPIIKNHVTPSMEVMPKQIASIDFKDKAFIQLWYKYREAVDKKDIPQILDILEKHLDELPFLEQVVIPFQFDFIMQSNNKKWKKRYVQLEDKVLPYMKTEQIKKAVKEIFAKYRQQL